MYLYSKEELGLLDNDTLHRILSSPFLSIESEDWLVRFLIELKVDEASESDRGAFLSHIELQFVSAEGLSLFLDSMSFDSLSESVWAQIVSRMKSESGAEAVPRRSLALDRRRHRCRSVFDSAIVDEMPPLFDEFEGKSMKLIYRGSRDGFGAADFHSKCDGQSNTITLIESTTGFIFGGFTPVAWDSSGQRKGDRTERSFLFTLKNPHNLPPRKFRLALGQESSSIKVSSRTCSCFGNDDLFICGGCDVNRSHSRGFGSTYENTTGIEGRLVFTGSDTFIVNEIEVFEVELKTGAD
jgi:hypothetical protein